MRDLNKFKKRIIVEALIADVLSLLAIGFSVATIILLHTRILGFWPAVLGGVAAAALFTPLARVFRINDTTVAKRLDRQLKLNNKIQTSVEFKDKSGLILDKQRETAQDALKTHSGRDLKIRLPFISGILFCVSVGLFCSACSYVPDNEPQPILPAESSISSTSSSSYSGNISDVLDNLQSAIENGDTDDIDNAVSDLKEYIDNNISNSNIASDMNQAADTIDSALEGNSNVAESDRDRLEDLASDLRDVASDMQTSESSKEETDGTDRIDSTNSGSAEQQATSTATPEEQLSSAFERFSGSGESADDATSADGGSSAETDVSGSDQQSGDSGNVTDGQSADSGKDGSATGGSDSGSGNTGGQGNNASYTGDVLYDGEYLDYGDVLDDMHNAALADAADQEDNDLADLLDDYFEQLYNKINP